MSVARVSVAMRRLILGVSVLALAACGQRADLKPVAGETLPPAPLKHSHTYNKR